MLTTTLYHKRYPRLHEQPSWPLNMVCLCRFQLHCTRSISSLPVRSVTTERTEPRAIPGTSVKPAISQLPKPVAARHTCTVRAGLCCANVLLRQPGGQTGLDTYSCREVVLSFRGLNIKLWNLVTGAKTFKYEEAGPHGMAPSAWLLLWRKLLSLLMVTILAALSRFLG